MNIRAHEIGILNGIPEGGALLTENRITGRVPADVLKLLAPCRYFTSFDAADRGRAEVSCIGARIGEYMQWQESSNRHPIAIYSLFYFLVRKFKICAVINAAREILKS